MNICTFNIKNSFLNHKNKNEMIYTLINKYDLDILCVQESTYKDLKSFNYNNYKSYGFGRLKRSNSIFNETNNIISDIHLTNVRTHYLPSYLTTFKRIYTVGSFIVNNSKYLIINTHLDFLNNISRKIQLNKIYNYIEKKHTDYNIILVGDFNVTTKEKYFIDFINKLDKLDIVLLSNNTPTIKSKVIDHVFLSKNIKVKEFRVINNDNIVDSDHFPIIVNLEI